MALLAHNCGAPNCAGLQLEDCRATLTSSQAEGVSVVAMDASRDALFVGDSAGYVHVLRLALAKGALLPLTQIERIPPAGELHCSCIRGAYTPATQQHGLCTGAVW